MPTSTTFNPPQDFMDFEKARIYLSTHTPEQVAVESRTWTSCSPTDILSIADVLSMALKADDHAIALYKEGLRRLDEHPEQMDPDTNIAFAYASLGQILTRKNRIEEAIDALSNAVRAGSDHSHIKTLLALNLQNTGRSQEAYQLIEEVFSYPEAKLSAELSPQLLEMAKGLRSYLAGMNKSQSNVVERMKQVWQQASTAMQVRDFKRGAELYKQAIELLHGIEGNPPANISPDFIKQNLANGYCDLASCLLEFSEVNSAVHALMEAMRYGNTGDEIKQNILYCLSQVNAFMEQGPASMESSGGDDKDFIRWHNEGYYLLKTPHPNGRDWGAAIRCLNEALRIYPDSAPTHHLLGLAYEGSQQDIPAINAWLKVKMLQPTYDFTKRVKF